MVSKVHSKLTLMILVTRIVSRGQRNCLSKDSFCWLLLANPRESSKPQAHRSSRHPCVGSQGFSDKYQGSLPGVAEVELRSSLPKLSIFLKVPG